MWTILKNRQVNGWKFRRQFSVGKYVLDFYCPQARLAIELDGEDHFTEAGFQYDERRTAFLVEHDIRVIRFENRDVFDAPEVVIDEIKQHLPPLPPPTRREAR